jgi:hypothetical protein
MMMVGDFMTEKGLKLIKFLYAVFFEKKTGKVLLIKTENGFELPGGEVEDVPELADERWKRDFLIKKIPIQTGLAAYLVEQEVQPMPATYEAYDFHQGKEFSAIIVSEIDSCQATNGKVRFCDVKQLKRLVREGKIARGQELLILRTFVSRDCPREKIRAAAAQLLRKKHQ